jgi:hypothetical protein
MREPLIWEEYFDYLDSLETNGSTVVREGVPLSTGMGESENRGEPNQTNRATGRHTRKGDEEC